MVITDTNSRISNGSSSFFRQDTANLMDRSEGDHGRMLGGDVESVRDLLVGESFYEVSYEKRAFSNREAIHGGVEIGLVRPRKDLLTWISIRRGDPVSKRY